MNLFKIALTLLGAGDHTDGDVHVTDVWTSQRDCQSSQGILTSFYDNCKKNQWLTVSARIKQLPLISLSLFILKTELLIWPMVSWALRIINKAERARVTLASSDTVSCQLVVTVYFLFLELLGRSGMLQKIWQEGPRSFVLPAVCGIEPHKSLLVDFGLWGLSRWAVKLFDTASLTLVTSATFPSCPWGIV